MTNAIKHFAEEHNSSQVVSSMFDLEILDNEVAHDAVTPPHEGDNVARPNVQIKYQDFGGHITAPWYKKREPGMNHYLSDLCVQNYAISDVISEINNVILYDERCMGKGANTLCSMRLVYHFNKFQSVV